MVTVVWFKRDLRVSDHPALASAAARGAPVLPLYIVEPALWTLPDASARQWAFVAECLDDLREALGRLGAPLVVRTGDAVDVLEDFRRAFGMTDLVSHEETGNLWTYGRDLRVAAWARETGVAWTEIPQSGVVRRLRGRDGWARRRDAFVFAAPATVPAALRGVRDMETGAIPSPRDFGLGPDACAHRQRGGRAGAERLLATFLTERGRDYRREMSSPVGGEAACSRLSPHLAHGTISVREAAVAVAARQREVRGTRDGWAGSLKSFQSRLAWRDHFMQKLEDEPEIETRCLHRAHEGRGRPARWSSTSDGADTEEGGSAGEDLRCLRPAVFVAEKVGEGLGRGALLFRALPAGAKRLTGRFRRLPGPQRPGAHPQSPVSGTQRVPPATSLLLALVATRVAQCSCLCFIQRRAGPNATGLARQVRVRPCFVDRTNPACSSLERCERKVGIEIPNGMARSDTVAGPVISRARIARRVGSDSAWKTESRRSVMA